MQTEDVIAFLEVPFGYPSSMESGNDLYFNVLPKASWLLEHEERSGVLEALRAWFAQRSYPRTWLATELAGALGLRELRPELLALRADIAAGKAFDVHELPGVDRALSGLETAARGPD